MACTAPQLASVASSGYCRKSGEVSWMGGSAGRSSCLASWQKSSILFPARLTPLGAAQRTGFHQPVRVLQHPSRYGVSRSTSRTGKLATSALQSKEREEAASPPAAASDVFTGDHLEQTSVLDNVFFAVFVTGGAVLSFACYPTVVELSRGSEPLSADLRTYVSQVSNITSLMFAILLGNTYSFIQERLKALLQATMSEVLALQRLMAEAMLEIETMPVWLCMMLANIERYFLEEIPSASLKTVEHGSVDADSAALQAMMALVLEHRRSNITAKQPLNLLSSAQQLGQCRCTRLAASESILPSLHWIILITLAVINAMAFPLLDPDPTVGSHSMQRYLFATVVTTVSVTLFVMVDFAYPLDGLYGIASMPNLAGIRSSIWRQLQENRKTLDWILEKSQ